MLHAVALAELHWPAGQYVQPEAPAALNVPAGQDKHDSIEEAPVVRLYVPPLHRVQVAAFAPLYEPGEHGIIIEAP